MKRSKVLRVNENTFLKIKQIKDLAGLKSYAETMDKIIKRVLSEYEEPEQKRNWFKIL